MSRQSKYHSTNRDYLLQIVQRRNKPFTAKEIANDISEQSPLSTSTIYRLLDEFTDDGTLRKKLGENPTAKYYYLAPCENKNHFYLECTNCHQIFHLDCRHIRNFAKHISKKHGFLISNYQLIISGLCANCQDKDE